MEERSESQKRFEEKKELEALLNADGAQHDCDEAACSTAPDGKLISANPGSKAKRPARSARFRHLFDKYHR